MNIMGLIKQAYQKGFQAGIKAERERQEAKQAKKRHKRQRKIAKKKYIVSDFFLWPMSRAAIHLKVNLNSQKSILPTEKYLYSIYSEAPYLSTQKTGCKTVFSKEKNKYISEEILPF